MLTKFASVAWVIVLLSLCCLVAFEVTISESRGHKAVVSSRPNTWGFEDPIVMIGDSLTFEAHSAPDFGFGIRLEAHFRRRRDILNRGISGQTASYIQPQIESILKSALAVDQSPSVLTLWLGTDEAYQNLPTEVFIKNMKDMIIFTKQKHPRTKILLITPAPMLEEEPRQRTQVLKNAVIQLASELNVGVLDSWKVLLGPSGEYNPSVSRFYYDDVHFNNLGHQVFFDEIVKHL